MARTAQVNRQKAKASAHRADVDKSYEEVTAKKVLDKSYSFDLEKLKEKLDKILSPRGGKYKINETNHTFALKAPSGAIDSGTLYQPENIILRSARNILLLRSHQEEVFIEIPKFKDEFEQDEEAYDNE